MHYMSTVISEKKMVEFRLSIKGRLTFSIPTRPTMHRGDHVMKSIK